LHPDNFWLPFLTAFVPAKDSRCFNIWESDPKAGDFAWICLINGYTYFTHEMAITSKDSLSGNLINRIKG
jgi:hypothetical protein